MTQSRRISSSLPNPLEARRWTYSGLPRIIVLAIGLHMFFCVLLITQVHTHHDYATKYSLLGSTNGRQRLHLKKKNAMFRRQGQVANNEEVSLEVDDLYVGHLENINQNLIDTLSLSNSVSCRWRNDAESIFEEDCSYHKGNNHSGETEGRVVLFNPLEQERILCDGTRISPAGILVLDEGDLPCSDPPRLFSSVPTVQAKEDMDPIELKFRYITRGTLPPFQCDVPCSSDEPYGVLISRMVVGTPFTIQHSMEGPQYYSNIRFLPTAHRRYHYYSTTSFESEIPLPYFSFDEYGDKIQGAAVNYTTAIKGAVFMARNCASRNNREALVESLIKSDFRIDSVSKCFHNAEIPDGLVEKTDIMSRYLFYLAFENQSENDYITEKLWKTLQSGTVPVYYGAPNAKQHVPPNSIIDANDFETSEDLANYLSLVASNQTLYESYHAWRNQPLPESFVTRYNMTRTHSTCRTCRWAAAKKYGLGWNHTTQTLEDLCIPRKVCHDAHGLTHPFREVWLSGNDKRPLRLGKTESHGEHEACATQRIKLSAYIHNGHHSVRRTIRNQDGVTDIHLEASKVTEAVRNDGFILQMRTTIDAEVDDAYSLKAMSSRHFRFQDTTKRMTILCSRNIEAHRAGKGVLELHIPNVQQSTNIRVIVEDIEPYRDSHRRANYFAQVMTEDFLNPLEKFVVWGSPANQSDWERQTMSAIGLISPEEEDEGDGTDDAIRIEEEWKKERRKETEAMRKKMVQIKKDEATIEAEKKAIAGVKKLIREGIIHTTKNHTEDQHPTDWRANSFVQGSIAQDAYS